MIVTHNRCKFQGSFVALPTPFRDGEVDWRALQVLLDFHAERGTDGVVVCGTTGEAATLTELERRNVIEAAVARTRGRMPVIAGIGTNCTRTSVANARFAASAGADALLVVTPYYNRPTPRGLVSHFAAIAEAVPTPIILYNVPSRTGCDMIPEVVAELGERFPHVVGVKEALASLDRARRLVDETPCGVLCGDDASIAGFMGVGAVGVIGVVNNVVPEKVAELVRCSVPGGNAVRTAELVAYLQPLVRDLFLESNPTPVKAALSMLLSELTEEVRLPLVTMEPANRRQVQLTMSACGLL